jgi:hypothetical protein
MTPALSGISKPANVPRGFGVGLASAPRPECLKRALEIAHVAGARGWMRAGGFDLNFQ